MIARTMGTGPRNQSRAGRRARQRPGAVAAFARFALLAGVALLAGFGWFALTQPGPAPLDLDTDAVVVLTGGPGRLARGLAVLRAESARRLLVSGVDQEVEVTELANAADERPSLFAAKVDLDRAAVDTRSNAAETAAWMAKRGYRSLRLVTSAAHMRRARLELDAVLPDNIAVVADAVPQSPSVRGLWSEYTKYLLRRVALAAGAA